MKITDKILKKLDELRDERFIKDKAFNVAYKKENLKLSKILFERVTMLEGNIEMLKWVLKEINNEK